ncbi:hypothetical protein GCM10012284_46510 [Mangrovihabitans endophyticus]|uniref:Sensor-like histidine kinase SenX3 n=2 Tax=Mangrovihabitans endophyticus TaxID=1751298 RepID=A0A8J3C256_9ACTN|nr:hypothetical protein GCM10012284_46510 [Mangrovihabitans endophyticus]
MGHPRARPRWLTWHVIAAITVTLACGAGTALLSREMAATHSAEREIEARHGLETVTYALGAALQRYADVSSSTAVALGGQSDLSGADFASLTEAAMALPAAMSTGLIVPSTATTRARLDLTWLDSPSSKIELRPDRSVTDHRYLMMSASADQVRVPLGIDVPSGTAAATLRQDARLSGIARASGPSPPAGDPRVPSGADDPLIMIVAPIYGTVGVPDAGLFRGWLETLVDARKLVRGAVGDVNVDPVDVTLGAGSMAVTASLAAPGESTDEPVESRFASLGQNWTVTLTSATSRGDMSGRLLAPLTAAFGSALSLGIGLFIFHLGRSRRRTLTEVNRAVAELAADVERGSLEAERLRARSRELQSSNRQIATRLERPLSEVSVELATARDFFATGLLDRGHDVLQHARRRTETMHRLVGDLLMMASMDDAAIRSETVDLARLLERVLDERQLNWPGSLGQVTVDPMPEVIGDPALLALVMDRLLENALTYVPPGGIPRVEVTADLTGPGWRGEYWRIAVRDQGIGIEAAERPFVFEAFRPIATTDGRHAGNRVSLALCRKIIRAHGGDIDVDENAGGGCVVRFTLPTRAERRHHRRVPFRTVARLRFPDRIVEGRTVDLSEGGARCAVSEPAIQPGSLADLELVIDGQAFSTTARVLVAGRTEPDGNLRLEFVGPGPALTAAIRRVLYAVDNGSGTGPNIGEITSLTTAELAMSAPAVKATAWESERTTSATPDSKTVAHRGAGLHRHSRRARRQ